MVRAIFSTLTNVNFDEEYFVRTVPEAISRRNALALAYATACAEKGVTPIVLPAVATWNPSGYDRASLEAAGVSVGVLERRATVGEEGA